MKMNHSLKVRFAGHETFTLKQLWLRKAVRFVQQAVKEGRQACTRRISRNKNFRFAEQL
ncbi:DUF4007 family protein [Parasutterella excrementihominis]|uniref:DUF4007 family protein n=1 Tax=Parasutterella excrementihominis TaxID=487175 RepID=UPI003AB5A030